MNFQVGDVVTIRPSQQLYWKLRLGVSSDCLPENFRSIIYKLGDILKLDNSTMLAASSISEIAQPDILYANSNWFDWDLEGNLTYDYARKSPNFQEQMNLFPHCKWCHTPICRHFGGIYHNHWEHTESYTYTWTKDGIKPNENKWACNTNNTCDGKWHVAEHPFLGTNDKGIDINPPKLVKPVMFYNGEQQLNYSTITHENHRLEYEVVETKKGRRFKNF